MENEEFLAVERSSSLHEELETLRNRFEEELERRKLDALAEFAAGAGHEINNPLAIIGGHAQLLLTEIEHPEHRRQLAIIAAQVRRAYEMIADIRYFARPPSPVFQRFEIVPRLELLIEEQTPLMEEKGIQLLFERNDESIELRSDPEQLHLALIFLCNNARDSLQSTGGTVRIGLDRMENALKISVEDDGDGVPDEVRPLMFNPYYSGRQAGRGLGFGLPKTWRIMQQLGGSIRYETPKTGKGARFVLQLPMDCKKK